MANGTYSALTIKRDRSPWAVYRRIYGEMKRNIGGAITEQANKSKAGASQSLISRGLYNTTVLDNMRTGIDRQAGIDIGRQAGAMTGQAMGMVGQMTPPAEMTPRSAQQMGYAAGSGSGGNIPDWFQKYFGRINSPQGVRLGA